MSRVLPETQFATEDRGYDWVVWQEYEGLIHAEYVFPFGPAAEAGLLPGDVFHALDYEQYFTVDDLQQAVQGMQPGNVGVYSVTRDGEFVPVEVRFSRDPTFLYPLSSRMWQFALWGFGIAAFLHVMGLTIVVPLARRSKKARFSLLLLFVSSLWIVGNLARLLLIEVFGPPLTPHGTYDTSFRVLTFIGLAGWLAFPALLLHKVVLDARLLQRSRLGPFSLLLYLPTAILAAGALIATVVGHLGPLTLNALAAPILFYSCTYIAAAAALMFTVHVVRPEQADEVLGRWNRTGSIITLILSVLAALSVLGLVSVLPSMTDIAAAWLIVSAQLLAVAPVVLVSHATLQYGKVDLVVSRALIYLALLGLIFFGFIGGMTILDPYLSNTGSARHVLGGVYVIVLLLLFARLARSINAYAADLLAFGGRRTRKMIADFQDEMRSILSPQVLARETARALAQAFGARSATVFLRPEGEDGPLVSGTYHPQPPFVTERFVSVLEPHFRGSQGLWARNAELREQSIPNHVANMLQTRGVAMALPLSGPDRASGILLLGGIVFTAVATIGLLRLPDLYSRAHAASKSEVRESAEAHLVALRAQINPHFLFNALNTIASLIEERPEEAEDTVERLAALFRHTLQTGSRAFVPLEAELELVSHYLQIEKARFGEKLFVDIHMDEHLAGYPVPAFAVQTLVENGVKHGLERQRRGGRIEIRCEETSEGLTIVVSDTGRGIPALFDRGAGALETSFYGVGLRNVAARLQMLYHRNDLLRISSDPERGTTATIHLPATPDESDGNGALRTDNAIQHAQDRNRGR